MGSGSRLMNYRITLWNTTQQLNQMQKRMKTKHVQHQWWEAVSTRTHTVCMNFRHKSHSYQHSYIIAWVIKTAMTSPIDFVSCLALRSSLSCFLEPEVILFGQAESLRTGGASNLSIRPLKHTLVYHQFFCKWDHNLLNKHRAALKNFWK